MNTQATHKLPTSNTQATYKVKVRYDGEARLAFSKNELEAAKLLIKVDPNQMEIVWILFVEPEGWIME